MPGFEDLAKRLESLGGAAGAVMDDAKRFAEDEIQKAGRDGGPLRGGNKAIAHVAKFGTSLVVTRVYSSGGFPYGIRNDFLARWIARRAEEEIRRRMTK